MRWVGCNTGPALQASPAAKDCAESLQLCANPHNPCDEPTPNKAVMLMGPSTAVRAGETRASRAGWWIMRRDDTIRNPPPLFPLSSR